MRNAQRTARHFRCSGAAVAARRGGGEDAVMRSASSLRRRLARVGGGDSARGAPWPRPELLGCRANPWPGCPRGESESRAAGGGRRLERSTCQPSRVILLAS